MTAPAPEEARLLDDLVDWAHAIAEGRGGPVFTAAILRGGAELVRAKNRVAETHDPSRHAEIEAMAAAGAMLGCSDLSDCVLVSSCQPCEMCLAAMRWAGIGRVVYAATRGRIGPRYFRFPHLSIERPA